MADNRFHERRGQASALTSSSDRKGVDGMQQ